MTESRIKAAEATYISARNAIERIPKLPRRQQMAEGAATAAAARIKKHHVARFTKGMRTSLGVDVRPLVKGPLHDVMSRFVDANVRLIKTIPPRYHDKLIKDLTKLAAGGEALDQAKLGEVLAKSYKAAGFNLRRIVRDQTQKLVSELNEVRQQQVGVEQYRWSTSGDDRVRPTHADNNGLVFRWDSPPAGTGHPGSDIMCRCIAVAIIPTKKQRHIRKHGPKKTPPKLPPLELEWTRAGPSFARMWRAPGKRVVTDHPLGGFNAAREVEGQMFYIDESLKLVKEASKSKLFLDDINARRALEKAKKPDFGLKMKWEKSADGKRVTTEGGRFVEGGNDGYRVGIQRGDDDQWVNVTGGLTGRIEDAYLFEKLLDAKRFAEGLPDQAPLPQLKEVWEKTSWHRSVVRKFGLEVEVQRMHYLNYDWGVQYVKKVTPAGSKTRESLTKTSGFIAKIDAQAFAERQLEQMLTFPSSQAVREVLGHKWARSTMGAGGKIELLDLGRWRVRQYKGHWVAQDERKMWVKLDGTSSKARSKKLGEAMMFSSPEDAVRALQGEISEDMAKNAAELAEEVKKKTKKKKTPTLNKEQRPEGEADILLESDERMQRSVTGKKVKLNMDPFRDKFADWRETKWKESPIQFETSMGPGTKSMVSSRKPEDFLGEKFWLQDGVPSHKRKPVIIDDKPARKYSLHAEGADMIHSHGDVISEFGATVGSFSPVTGKLRFYDGLLGRWIQNGMTKDEVIAALARPDVKRIIKKLETSGFVWVFGNNTGRRLYANGRFLGTLDVEYGGGLRTGKRLKASIGFKLRGSVGFERQMMSVVEKAANSRFERPLLGFIREKNQARLLGIGAANNVGDCESRALSYVQARNSDEAGKRMAWLQKHRGTAYRDDMTNTGLGNGAHVKTATLAKNKMPAQWEDAVPQWVSVDRLIVGDEVQVTLNDLVRHHDNFRVATATWAGAGDTLHAFAVRNGSIVDTWDSRGQSNGWTHSTEWRVGKRSAVPFEVAFPEDELPVFDPRGLEVVSKPKLARHKEQQSRENIRRARKRFDAIAKSQGDMVVDGQTWEAGLAGAMPTFERGKALVRKYKNGWIVRVLNADDDTMRIVKVGWLPPEFAAAEWTQKTAKQIFGVNPYNSLLPNKMGSAQIFPTARAAIRAAQKWDFAANRWPWQKRNPIVSQTGKTTWRVANMMNENVLFNEENKFMMMFSKTAQQWYAGRVAPDGTAEFIEVHPSIMKPFGSWQSAAKALEDKWLP